MISTQTRVYEVVRSNDLSAKNIPSRLNNYTEYYKRTSSPVILQLKIGVCIPLSVAGTYVQRLVTSGSPSQVTSFSICEDKWEQDLI